MVTLKNYNLCKRSFSELHLQLKTKILNSQLETRTFYLKLVLFRILSQLVHIFPKDWAIDQTEVSHILETKPVGKKGLILKLALMIMVTTYFKLKLFQETLFPICQDKMIGSELRVKEDMLTLKEWVELRKVHSIKQAQIMKIINHKWQT